MKTWKRLGVIAGYVVVLTVVSLGAWIGNVHLRHFGLILIGVALLVIGTGIFTDFVERRSTASYWKRALRRLEKTFPSSQQIYLREILDKKPSLILPTMLFYSALADSILEVQLRLAHNKQLDGSVSADFITKDVYERVENAINRMVAGLPVARLTLKRSNDSKECTYFGDSLTEAWVRAVLELEGQCTVDYDAKRFNLSFKSGSSSSAATFEKACEMVLRAGGWRVVENTAA